MRGEKIAIITLFLVISQNFKSAGLDMDVATLNTSLAMQIVVWI